MIKKDHNGCVKAEFIMVIRTQFPFFEFFYKILF